MLCAASAQAQTTGTTSAGLVYSDSAGSVTITGYTGGAVALSIPSSIAGDPVTAIADFALRSAPITGLTLPSSLTSIGLYSIEECAALKTVSIPASVTSVGIGAFYNCANLASITVDPASPYLSSDGMVLFDKPMATLIECPGAAAGAYAVPSSVTSINSVAFDSCQGLTSITLPAGLLSIGNSSFAACTELTSLAIPANVATIGPNAFMDCERLTTFTVDPSNPNFSSDGQALFDKAQATLISYVSDSHGAYSLPGTVTTIGIGAFNQSNLTSISIPDSVATIGASAFDSCQSLTTLSLPASVTSIGTEPFYNCVALTSFSVDPSNPSYSSVGGVLYDKTGTDLIAYPPGRSGSYSVPAGVTTIGVYAFANCIALGGVALPASLVTIDQGAFSEMYLTTITIPAAVANIGYNAFQGDSDLTRIYFLGNAPVIDPSAFSGANSSLKVIYQQEAAGWTSSLAGVPALLSASLPRLINISTRATVGTGAGILIPGFVITGSGQETLLIRADGPALSHFSITGFLAAPSLSVLDSAGNSIATNTGWSTASNAALLASTASSVGAFALQPDSADCAVIVNLSAGAYTVQVSGVGNTTGVALAEIFEVATTGTRLVNISTRAQVGTGANIIIAGFVISGTGEEDLLLRGDGPGLTQFSVPGVLAQPEINLFDSAGTSIASVAQWGQNGTQSQIEAIAAEVGAFALTPGSLDSAMTTSLAPGNYTMQISGAGGTTGVALAEVYEAP